MTDVYRETILRERRESMRRANAVRLSRAPRSPFDVYAARPVAMTPEAVAARVAALDAALGRTR